MGTGSLVEMQKPDCQWGITPRISSPFVLFLLTANSTSFKVQVLVEWFGFLRINGLKQFQRGDGMKQSAKVTLLAWGLLMAVSGVAQAAGDAAAGKQKSSMCVGCHEIDGYRTAYPKVYNVPKLRGQHAEYLLKSLEGYKSKNRSHPSMDAIAASLSAQDMEDLVAYYTSGGK
jgi:cytochrome c553